MFFKYQQPSNRLYRKDDDPGGEGGTGGDDDKGNKGGDDLKAIQASLADMQTKLDDATNENTRLSAKLSESNKHTKEAERKAAADEKSKHEADGNYKELYESSEKTRLASEERETKLQNVIDQGKVGEIARRITRNLKPLESALSDLEAKVSKRLKSTDDGVKVLDKSGNLTVSTFDQLQEEFVGSADISYMLQGNQSTGGGAHGGEKGGGSAPKEISRADFDALNDRQKAAEMKAGTVVV